MTGQILVALTERDRIQEIIPVLQKVAKPGMKVTFLIPYPIDAWAWLRDHWITTESTKQAVAEGKRILAKYSWHEQKRLAERKIIVARDALEKMGVEVALMFKQRLRPAIRECVLSEEFQVILMSAGRGETAMGLAQAGLLLLRRIKPPRSRSLFLYRLERCAEPEHSTAMTSYS